jgi:VanZ family protein
MSPSPVPPPCPSDRGNQIWRIVAALAGLIILAAVLGLAPGQKHTALADSVQTVGHFGFFALFAMVVAIAAGQVASPIAQHRGWQYVIGLGVAVIAGSVLELAQKFIPLRMATWNDLGHDSLGAVAGIALIMAWRGGRAAAASERRLGYLASAVLAVATLMGTRQFVTCARDYWYRRDAYPDLIVFGQDWTDRFLWLDEGVELREGELPSTWPRDVARQAVTVVFRPDQGKPFPGIGVKEPYPDWRGRSVLAFDVLNPGPSALAAGLRVHDFQHTAEYYDRFNQVLPLEPGFQTIRIPLDAIERGPRHRRLNLSHVEGLKLFLIRPTEPVRLVVGNFRLE